MCEKMKQVIFIFPHKILLGLLRLPPPLPPPPELRPSTFSVAFGSWFEFRQGTVSRVHGWGLQRVICPRYPWRQSEGQNSVFFFFFSCPGWAAGRPETESYLEVINIFSCPNGLEFLRHWSCNHNITGSSPAISYPLPTVCHLHKAKKMGVCSQISVKIMLILHRSEKSTVLRQRVLLSQYSIVSSSWPACFSF